MSDYLVVTMYLDEATSIKYFSAGAAGIDNQDFVGRVVPFAPHSPGDQIALKKYARAHRAGYVEGPPARLLTLKIPARFAVHHFLAQDIKVMDNRPEETVGFARPVNATYYPSLQAEVTEIDVPGGPSDLLRAGYELLS